MILTALVTLNSYFILRGTLKEEKKNKTWLHKFQSVSII